MLKFLVCWIMFKKNPIQKHASYHIHTKHVEVLLNYVNYKYTVKSIKCFMIIITVRILQPCTILKRFNSEFL